MDIYERELKTAFKDVDASGRMTPFAAFDCFQEAAETHAGLLGVGRGFMMANNQVWVLSRMSVLFDARPRLDGVYTIRTLPLGCDRLFFVRDYEIKNDSGASLVRARSGWLVLDIKTRRPLRPQSLNFSVPENKGRDIMRGTPPALVQRDNLVKIAERRAAYSDIDFNSHINNARYVQWIEDIVDYNTLTGADKMRIDINYLNEIKAGDLTELLSADIADDANDSGFNNADFKAGDFQLALEGRKEGGAAFRAEIRIAK